MPYNPGDTILDKYSIVKALGQGAFGEVYLVTHLGLNVPRAIKVLRKNLPGWGANDYENARKRFRLEARLGAQLNSPAANPYLLQVHNLEDRDELLLLEMEYAAGGNLKDKIAGYVSQKKAMPVADALRIAVCVAEGLAALHANQSVHRDVKPSNILFDEHGNARLGDLGIAQTWDDLTDRGDLGSLAPSQPGDPYYMSPEQGVTRAALTFSSDIYSLGLVLFEMLTGQNYRFLEPGTHLRNLRADVSPALDDLLAQMLAKDPEARPWNGEKAARLLKAELESLTRAAEDRRPAADQTRKKSEERALEQAPQDNEQKAQAVPSQLEHQPAKGFRGLVIGLVLSGLVLALGWYLINQNQFAAATPVPTQASTVQPAAPILPSLPAASDTPVPRPSAKPASTLQSPNDYTVAMGDTCTSIAKRFGVSVQSIIVLNNLPVSCNTLVIGQQIKISSSPNTSLLAANPTVDPTQVKMADCNKLIYTVTANDTLGSISENYSVPVDAIKAYNGLTGSTVFVGMNLIIPLCESAATANPAAMPAPSPTSEIGATWIRPADGMTMLYVPGGTFTMGSPDILDAAPYRVTLSAYWIDKTDVTNSQYSKCVQSGVCKPPVANTSVTRISYYGNSQYQNYPVINIDWNQAKNYCVWAGKVSNTTIDLPSEAQWELAARGMDGRTYPWGQTIDKTYANYNGNVGDTTAVCSYPQGNSPYGACDMAGNVWQWVTDLYAAYPGNTDTNPYYGMQNRVLRGGSWLDNSDRQRSANRFFDDQSNMNSYEGFRCARSK